MAGVVVIGGSSGALEPLKAIVRGLPMDLPAAVCVVVHSSPDAPSVMPAVLARHAGLPVAFAEHGAPLRAGNIVVAPPDNHLLVTDGRFTVTRGPRENGFRPAVDPLFRTAARSYGARVVGVLLSGGLDDGTRGLASIKEAGGTTIVQRVDEATISGMPANAIRNVAIDHILPAAEMASVIARAVRNGARQEKTLMRILDAPDDRAARGTHALTEGSMPGPPTVFTCPECGGTLWEVANGGLVRFACHVGHSYSPESLETGMADVLESALWTALRVLEENATFFRRMRDRAAAHHMPQIASGYGTKADDAQARADVVRQALVSRAPAGQPAASLEASPASSDGAR